MKSFCTAANIALLAAFCISAAAKPVAQNLIVKQIDSLS
jgi:hypothetical protein